MAKESYEKWMEMIEDLKWTQACEHQENFEKAAVFGYQPFLEIGRRKYDLCEKMVGTSKRK